MSDLPPPVAPGPPVQPVHPFGPAEPNAGMPMWGILVIVGSALAVGVIAFLVILGLTSLGAAPQAGSDQPSTGQQESEQPADDEPAGVTYTSDEFGYEVAFPGEATEISTPQSVGGYDLEIATASWAAGDRNVSVNATAFPDGLYAADATDEMLQGSLDGAAGSVGGTLENVEFIDIQGERAITGVIRAGIADIYMLVVFHTQTQYSIASVNGTQEEHDQIVGSFHFLD